MGMVITNEYGKYDGSVEESAAYEAGKDVGRLGAYDEIARLLQQWGYLHAAHLVEGKKPLPKFEADALIQKERELRNQARDLLVEADKIKEQIK